MMGIQAAYYDKHPAGELLSAVTSDTEIAVSRFVNVVITVPGICFYLTQALPQINSFSPKLMWAILILIPFYIIYSLVVGRWQYKVGRVIQLRIGSLTGFLSERIRNLMLIKSFVTEQEEDAKGRETAKALYKANVDDGYVQSVLVAYTFIAEIIGIVIAVIWGCALLRSGEINMEQWLSFYLFAPTINTAIRQLTNAWTNLKDVQGRAARLGAMMLAPQDEMNSDTAADIPQGDIRLEHVTFGYNEEGATLNDIDLTVPFGGLTAIVGPSGSGKTTVLRLLEKLYEPQAGQITIGGCPLGSLNLSAWRGGISYINQEAEIFSGTIREVLTYGVSRNVTEDELWQAATAAGIDRFIRGCAQGFDTELTISGGSLSGGQRQRLVIAREIVRNAGIILLDEPTSALDAETASAITDIFFNGFAGRTMIAVTHELRLIARADRIIVLDHGQVKGIGTHEQLMKNCRLYHDLVEEQSYQEVFLK